MTTHPHTSPLNTLTPLHFSNQKHISSASHTKRTRGLQTHALVEFDALGYLFFSLCVSAYFKASSTAFFMLSSSEYRPIILPLPSTKMVVGIDIMAYSLAAKLLHPFKSDI